MDAYLGLSGKWRGLRPMLAVGAGPPTPELLREEVQLRDGLSVIAGILDPADGRRIDPKAVVLAARELSAWVVADLGELAGAGPGAAAAARCDLVLLAAHPTIPSTRGARRALAEVTEAGGGENVRLLINMAPRGRWGDAWEVGEALGAPLMGRIPLLRAGPITRPAGGAGGRAFGRLAEAVRSEGRRGGLEREGIRPKGPIGPDRPVGEEPSWTASKPSR
ncbi:MAG: hypothetical protein ACRDIF_07755 [Actinomycetota bacterium]